MVTCLAAGTALLALEILIMDKQQFDMVCQASGTQMRPAGNSYSCMSHKICIGAHWYYGDSKVAVFVENNGEMLYSNVSIVTPEELVAALADAKDVFDSAMGKQISYERLDYIPAEGINVSGKGVIV